LPCFVLEKCFVYSGFAWHAVQVGAGLVDFAADALSDDFAADAFASEALEDGAGKGIFISASLPGASGVFVPDDPPESIPSWIDMNLSDKGTLSLPWHIRHCLYIIPFVSGCVSGSTRFPA
jgi:hypothetical protein